MAGTISVEARDRVLLATLVNPPHGLMDRGTVDALEALVTRAGADPGVGAVVLTGAHPERFVAHYDVAEILRGSRAALPVGRAAAAASLRAIGALRRLPRAQGVLARTPAAGLVALERFHAVLLAMQRSDAVFVAAINGHAGGGGCELALACDVRLMARGAFGLGQPEILLGFPPGGGGTQRLARLLGTARAVRIALEGAPLTPDEAAEAGLVDQVVAPDALLDEAVALAARLGSRPKAGVGAVKRAVYEGGSLPLADGLRLERAEFLAALGTPEAQAAMGAYLEAFQRTGELPAYDDAAATQARSRGRFA